MAYTIIATLAFLLSLINFTLSAAATNTTNTAVTTEHLVETDVSGDLSLTADGGVRFVPANGVAVLGTTQVSERQRCAATVLGFHSRVTLQAMMVLNTICVFYVFYR